MGNGEPSGQGRPLKTGDRIELGIDSVAFGGDGVGRHREQVIFVPFTVEGDEAVVRIVETRKRFARGRIERIVAPSPHRVEAPCRHHSRCGGCAYQHIRYEHQLRIKTRQVAEAFTRIGRVASPPVVPAVPSPRPFHYRTKADYHVRRPPRGPVLLGFMDPANREVVDIERCEIVDETINAACLVFRRELADGRAASPPERRTVWAADASGEPAAWVTDLRPPRYVTRTVMGHPLQVPCRGFFQSNGALLPLLVEHVLGVCALTGRETVADLFCGSGLFSYFIAPRARRIYGIEADGEAIRCARWNLRRAGFSHASFHRGDAGDGLRKLFTAGRQDVQALILDPPRAGCSPSLISAVAELRPAKVVYISCHPATQARDVRLLTGRGFRLKSLRPFDMFPHTAHIETVALLES